MFFWVLTEGNLPEKKMMKVFNKRQHPRQRQDVVNFSQGACMGGQGSRIKTRRAFDDQGEKKILESRWRKIFKIIK